jgi:hypothetical protein
LKATADNPITQLETSPVIQGAAVGTLTAMGVVAAPTVIGALGEVSTTIVGTIEATAKLSIATGAADGILKAVTNTPPDTPYAIGNPAFQVSSDVANFITNFFINPPPTSPNNQQSVTPPNNTTNPDEK